MQERRRENSAAVNERIDYKVLFEKEKLEKERCEQRLRDMERKQQVLENNLRKFLDLKNEFSFLHHEAEESDKMVNNFIMVRSCRNENILTLDMMFRLLFPTLQAQADKTKQISQRTVSNLLKI